MAKSVFGKLAIPSGFVLFMVAKRKMLIADCCWKIP